MNKKLLWGMAGAAIVAVLVWALFFRSDGAKAVAANNSGYELSEITRGPIKRSVSTNGSVRALVMVEVGSQLSGKVDKVLVDYNSEVKQGDLLATIEPDTFASAVEAQQAQLDIARASLGAAEANLRKSEALYVQRQSDYERFAPLVDDGAVSELDLDATRTQVDTAKADVDAATAQVVNARAVVAQRQASLRQSKVDLERTEIRSPIDGVVISRNIDDGQTVAASFSAPILFTIAQDLSKIQIEAKVNEADIGAVREGNAVSFTVDAYPDRNFEGEVRQVRIVPVEEQNIVSYTVVINANNPGKILFPGMTATVDIVTGEREDVLRVANSVLRYKPANLEAPSAGRGGGGGDRAAQMQKLASDLGLSDDQQKQIREKMRAVFAGGGVAGNPRDEMAKVMKSVLTDDQWEKYQAIQAENVSSRPGIVYKVGADNAPEAVPVRFGIADTSFTEIITDQLKEKDSVILREAKE